MNIEFFIVESLEMNSWRRRQIFLYEEKKGWKNKKKKS